MVTGKTIAKRKALLSAATLRARCFPNACRGTLSVFLAAALCATAVASEHEDSVRLYRTREEQREAGLHRELTPWLRASGLAELEWVRDRVTVEKKDNNIRDTDRSATLQLGLVASASEKLQSELVVEYDTDVDELEIDEFTGTLELEPWELSIGRQYLPFGEYFSRFVSGPLLEFGEIRDTAATLAYGFDDRLDLSLSVYRGIAKKLDSGSRGTDWTLALETWAREDLALGLSYQSNLADADSRPLADYDNRFARRVPGLSGYVLYVGDRFEATVEALGAARSFAELESDRNRPTAWNLELALFLHPRFDLAFRVEGSRELEDEPRLQWGAAVTVLLHRSTTITLEILHARFRDDLAADDDDNAFEHRNRIGAQLSIGF